MQIIGVIPARWAASRFPGKPLAMIQNKPMVQWTYESAARVAGLDKVIVATDDERIKNAVEQFGGKALLTSSALQSGTDRVAAVAEAMDGDIFVNIQGDEPLIEPHTIEAALAMVTQHHFPIGSAMTPLLSEIELDSRHVVKVLVDNSGRALTFSRFPIPYSRIAPPTKMRELCCYRHLGIYVYRKEALMKFRSLPPCSWEQGESLEQLRALYHGHGHGHGLSIGVALVESKSIGVDTPEDLNEITKRLKGNA